jgi:MFS family permease
VGLAAADSSIVVLALPDVYRDFDVSIVAVSQTITAYNVAIVLGALAVIPLESRVRGHILAGTGLAVFAVASLWCGLAGSFTLLIVARTIQGFGAAFALAGAVPVLAGIRRSDEHAIATWALAGTIGAAIGPALGGVLTELFSWRSIFLFQAPVAALALIPAVDRRARAVELPPTRDRPEGNGLANVGFLLLYGALVGALFLAVLLLVVVWGWSPITGALVVSAIPLGAIVVRKLGPLLPARFAVVTGGVALSGGLLGLAYLPAASAGWAAPALFACGLGLGLLSGILSPVSVSPSVPDVGAATISIAARHAGFVIALAVIAPVLSSALDTAALDATRATTAEILDSSIGYRAKIDLAFDLRDLVADTPRGEVPDPSEAFAGADDDADLAATRDGVVSAVQDTVTRAFRSSFLIGAAFGAAAAIVALCLPGLRSVARHPDAITLASVVMVLVVALVAAEFRAGARDYGTREYVAPCDAPADPFPQGDGLDGTIQRIALSTINGGACELGTSREDLLLSMEPKSGFGPEITYLPYLRATVLFRNGRVSSWERSR